MFMLRHTPLAARSFSTATGQDGGKRKRKKEKEIVRNRDIVTRCPIACFNSEEFYVRFSSTRRGECLTADICNFICNILVYERDGNVEMGMKDETHSGLIQCVCVCAAGRKFCRYLKVFYLKTVGEVSDEYEFLSIFFGLILFFCWKGVL